MIVLRQAMQMNGAADGESYCVRAVNHVHRPRKARELSKWFFPWDNGS